MKHSHSAMTSLAFALLSCADAGAPHGPSAGGAFAIEVVEISDATVGASFTARLRIRADSPSNVVWVVASGALPEGLHLRSEATAAFVEGTPQEVGTFWTVVEATDDDLRRAQQLLAVVVRPAEALRLSADELPGAVELEPYEARLSASGGLGPPYVFTWTGTIAPGIELAAEEEGVTISGVPTEVGAFEFELTAVTNTATVTTPYVLRVDSAVELPTDQHFSNGNVGTSYRDVLIPIVRGRSSLGVELIDGQLPQGTTIRVDELTQVELAGTPEQSGTYRFTLRLSVGEAPVITTEQVVAIDRALVPLEIVTSTLPDAVWGVPYETPIQTRGGSGASYTWSGDAPRGLAIGDGTPHARLGGVPGELGRFTFVARVRDSDRQSSHQSVFLTVRPAPDPSVTRRVLPVASLGVTYTATITARDTVGTHTWSSSGDVPPGLSLMPSLTDTVRLEGVPTSTGTFVFTAEATDGTGQSYDRRFVVHVRAPVRQVVFVADQTSGGASVFAGVFGGDVLTGVQEIAPHGGGESAARPAITLAPSGRWVTMSGRFLGRPTRELYVADPSAPPGSAILLSEVPFSHGVAWSPSADRFALVTSDSSSAALFIADVSPSAQWTFTQIDAVPGRASFGALVWSNDGEQLAYATDDAIYVVNPGQPQLSSSVRFAPPYQGVGHLAWLPDDGGLVFGRTDATSGLRMFLAERTGTTFGPPVPISPQMAGPYYFEETAWSPGRRFVALHLESGSSRTNDMGLLVDVSGNIVRTTALGSQPVGIGRRGWAFQNPVMTTTPVWSPDGERLLFGEERAGQSSLRVVEVGDASLEARTLNVRVAPLASVGWLADARSIFFFDSSRAMIEMDLSTGRQQALLTLGYQPRTLLFRTRSPRLVFADFSSIRLSDVGVDPTYVGAARYDAFLQLSSDGRQALFATPTGIAIADLDGPTLNEVQLPSSRYHCCSLVTSGF